MAPDTLSHALAYSDKLPGRLLQVVSGGKRPSIADWVNRASRDEAVLRAWFDDTRDNMGWTPDPGYFVLDIDTHTDDRGMSGFDTLAELEARHGALPATLSASTPTGGKHMLFQCDSTLPVKSIVGSKVGFSGLDIRAHTGQIVVAPSTRPEGAYRWENWDPLTEGAPDIAQAPQWLVHLACGVLRPDGAVIERPRSQRVGGADGKVPLGARNAALVSEAGALRRRGWGYDAIVEALSALSETQFEEPVEDNEVRAVAKWACGFEPDDVDDIANVRDAETWGKLIDESAGNLGAVVEVARGVSVDPALSATEAEALIKRASKAAGVSVKVLRQDLARPASGDSIRPVIEVRRADFAGSVDSALRVLPHVPALRVRSGALVEIQDGRIWPVNAARLAYLASGVARWRYGDGDGAPDPAILQAVLSAGAWPGVPELVGLLRQPTVDAGGNMLCTPGNHAGFEAIFNPNEFSPYEGTGADALGELRALLAEFPFRTAGDESAALAGMLTAVVRPMLSTAPAFLVTASDLGSGKTYLAQILGEFAADGVPVQRWPQRPEEQDKGLLGLLIEGRSAVIYDNLVRDWSSPTLAAILTGPTYSDRLLGGNSTPSVSTRTLFIATGNNVRPAADMARRVMTVELDPRCESPWTRAFSADPLATVRADRGRWVMIALRVLEDYLQRGTVPPLQSLASFEAWSRVVRGALVHYGLADPLSAVTRNIESDDERDLLARLLAAWSEAFGDEPVTVRQVEIESLRGRPGSPLADLRAVFEDIAQERGAVNIRKLGNWLRINQGRIVAGRQLVAAGRLSAGVAWQVGGLVTRGAPGVIESPRSQTGVTG